MNKKKNLSHILKNTLLTGTAFALSLQLGVPSHATTFTDIGNHWAKSYIESAFANGSVSGYEDGTFKPDSNVTYAEVAVMLANVAYDVSAFSSVGGTHWADSHVAALKSKDSVGAVQMILSGSSIYGNTATREDVCYLVGAILDESGTVSRSSASTLSRTFRYSAEFGISYNAGGDFKNYTEDRVRAQLIGNTLYYGIMTGKSDSHFATEDLITRAEMAVILNNLASFLSENEVLSKNLNWYTAIPDDGFSATGATGLMPDTLIYLAEGSSSVTVPSSPVTTPSVTAPSTGTTTTTPSVTTPSTGTTTTTPSTGTTTTTPSVTTPSTGTTTTTPSVTAPSTGTTTPNTSTGSNQYKHAFTSDGRPIPTFGAYSGSEQGMIATGIVESTAKLAPQSVNTATSTKPVGALHNNPYDTSVYVVPTDVNLDGYITEAEFEARVEYLKTVYVEGEFYAGSYFAYQGNMGGGAIECAAWAYLLSDEIFGTLPRRTVNAKSMADVRVGDLMHSGSHWTVLMNPDGLYGDCIVSSGNNAQKSFSWTKYGAIDTLNNNIESGKYTIYTRFPA